jgi:hypothetical protein
MSSNAADDEPRIPHSVEPLGSLRSAITRNTPALPLIDGLRVVSVISGQPVQRTGSPLLTPPIDRSIIREKVDHWLDNVEEAIATTSGKGDHDRIDAGQSFGHPVFNSQEAGCMSSPASLA